LGEGTIVVLVLNVDAEPTPYEISMLHAWWLRCPLAEQGSRLQVRVRGHVRREYQYPLLNDGWDGPTESEEV
jgi:hypothetical protein